MRLHHDREDVFTLNTPPAFAGGACPKLAAARRWVSRRLGTTRHEDRVVAIASTLFDLTRPLHDLPPASRRLLRLAAMVHDVGRCVSKKNHPADGATMLAADTSLPVTSAERRALAYLTMYHRGPVPMLGHDAILAKGDDAQRLLVVLALLRAADALDSRSLQPARLVFALTGMKRPAPHRELRATCYLEHDCPKARKVYTRRKKFRLLEELLQVQVHIDIAHAYALRMVA